MKIYVFQKDFNKRELENIIEKGKLITVKIVDTDEEVLIRGK